MAVVWLLLLLLLYYMDEISMRSQQKTGMWKCSRTLSKQLKTSIERLASPILNWTNRDWWKEFGRNIEPHPPTLCCPALPNGVATQQLNWSYIPRKENHACHIPSPLGLWKPLLFSVEFQVLLPIPEHLYQERKMHGSHAFEFWPCTYCHANPKSSIQCFILADFPRACLALSLSFLAFLSV
jgi:hypothetical protein